MLGTGRGKFGAQECRVKSGEAAGSVPLPVARDPAAKVWSRSATRTLAAVVSACTLSRLREGLERPETSPPWRSRRAARAARPLVASDGRPAQPTFIREKYPTDSRGHTLGGLATETAHGEERTEAKDGDAVRGAVFESGGSPGTNARASAPRTGSGERAYHRVGGRRSWRERQDRRRRRERPVRSQRCRVAAPRPHRLSASACERGGCAGACPGREGWPKRRVGRPRRRAPRVAQAL